jgi:hypothetical protein
MGENNDFGWRLESDLLRDERCWSPIDVQPVEQCGLEPVSVRELQGRGVHPTPPAASAPAPNASWRARFSTGVSSLWVRLTRG